MLFFKIRNFMSKKIVLGAHVSIAGGFWKALERAHEIGATAAQIFTKSNRQWIAKKITNDDIKSFLDAKKNFKINNIIVHASYLINLGSEKKDVQEKSIKALAEEINRCQLLEISYLVLHPGSNPSQDISKTCQLIAENINKVFEITPPKKTMLLLETMAGQGSTVGNTFESLAEIMKYISLKKNIGICIDTCHLFAAGYEFNDDKVL
jgi:deoxyribonuclease-4